MGNPHPSHLVQNAAEVVAEHMDAIMTLFKTGAKITVLVRAPDFPDGSRDFVQSNDVLGEAIRALSIRDKDPQP